MRKRANASLRAVDSVAGEAAAATGMRKRRRLFVTVDQEQPPVASGCSPTRHVAETIRTEEAKMQLFKRNREREAANIGAVVAEQASAAANQAGRMVEQGMEQAGKTYAAAREQGQQAADNASEALEDWRSTIETSVRAQPVTALIIAALAGMAFGALWRSGEK